MSKYEDGPFFLDADGFMWRDNQDGSISMARTNPANTDTPEPFAYLVSARERCYICRPGIAGVSEEGCADCDREAGLHQRIDELESAIVAALSLLAESEETPAAAETLLTRALYGNSQQTEGDSMST